VSQVQRPSSCSLHFAAAFGWEVVRCLRTVSEGLGREGWWFCRGTYLRLPRGTGRALTAVCLSQGGRCNGDRGDGHEGQWNVHRQAAQFHWGDLQNRGDPAGSAVQDRLRQGGEVGELVPLPRGDLVFHRALGTATWYVGGFEDPKRGDDHKLNLFIRKKRGTHAQLT